MPEPVGRGLDPRPPSCRLDAVARQVLAQPLVPFAHNPREVGAAPRKRNGLFRDSLYPILANRVTLCVGALVVEPGEKNGRSVGSPNHIGS